MGRLHTLGKIEIRVNGRDHLPPHFHVVHHDFQALVLIETMVIHKGSIPGAHLRAVIDWAVGNRDLIVAEWNRCNPRLQI